MTSALTSDDVLDAVRATVLEVLPDLAPEAVTLDGNLTDLGANSIDRADIVTMVQERLGIAVPVTELRAVRDISSLVDVMWRHL